MLYNLPPRSRCRYKVAALAALLFVIGLPLARAQAHIGLAAPPVLDRSEANRIVRITVVGNSQVPTADIVARLKQQSTEQKPSEQKPGEQKAGQTPTIAAEPGWDGASINVGAVHDMGVFSSITVTVSPDPKGGKDVTCTVVENGVVKAIRFTTNTPDGKPPVPEATLIGRMHTAVGQVLNTNTLASDLDSLFNRDTGYVRAQGYICDAGSHDLDRKSGILTIPLVEASIGKIEVQGNGPVPAADILASMGIKPGDFFDINAVQPGLRRVAELHQFPEYGMAQFTPDQAAKVAATVTVRVPRKPFGTFAADPTPPIPVSYGGYVGGPVVVPVRVNDHAVGHFILVSNADLSEISSAFAASLGLTPQPMLEGGLPYFVEGQRASAVSLDRMTLGGATGVEVRSLSLPVVDMAALSKQIGQTIDGILGADLLSRVAFGIDFPRRRVTFWNHGHLSAAERSAAGFGGAVAMPAAPLYGTLPMLAVAGQVRSGATVKAFPLMIATGIQTSRLPAAAAATLGMTPLPNPDDPATVFSRASRLDLPDLSLNAPLFQLTDGDIGTTLGLNVLSQYRVLLDGPAGRAWFAPEVAVAGGDPHRTSLAVPFQFDHLTMPYPIVQVSINGHPPLPFLFDTGTADALAIDRWAAQALGLRVDDGASRTINGSISAQTAPVSTAVLQGRTPADNVKVSLEQAIVTDLHILQDAIIGQHIAGIIGAGMLGDTPVHFDFPSRTLTFFPGRADVPTPPGTITLPLSERANEGNYFATFTPTSSEPVRMLVDSGSGGTELPYEMRAALRPIYSSVTGHSMLGSMALGQDLLLQRLPFAGMPEGGLTVSVFPTNDAPGHWHPAIVGMDILSRLAVTLDIPHMRLLLAPPPTETPPVYHGWVGIRLAQEGSQFRIKQVLPASPAAQAGMKAGDILLTVDGRPLAGLSLVNVRTLADGLAGTPAAFQIRRAGGTPRTVRFRRASVSGDPPSPLDGIFGLREAANPFAVRAVVPGCPAAQAGIAAGDTITAINGQATSSLSVEQWETLLLLTRLTLIVDRAGVSRTVVLVSAPQEKTPAGQHQQALEHSK